MPRPASSRLLALTLTLFFAALPACATTTSAPLTAQPPLYTTDGAPFSLLELLDDSPATVLIWWASTCPCVKRYEKRVAALAQRHPALTFVHIASNADDGPEEIARAKAPLPILHDPTGELATQLGVRSTPTVVVLSPTGAVLYRGWLDNEHDVNDPDREPWLEDKLARIARGDEALTQTPTWGCTVTRSLGQAGRCHLPPSSVSAPESGAPGGELR